MKEIHHENNQNKKDKKKKKKLRWKLTNHSQALSLLKLGQA
jgi:hypothetical protein